ncbi:hypothetical protein RDWZM_003134 [Blomia tropicalis]|uniref:Ig-like domain-containing protein n=1 Tax=Blomia tropicalis TaxID=40697 RepID=A0A9Q0RS85_BLOTA|nr:hypothetical protein RDWZM_003134 [Blomia tropicalis]
MLSNGNSSIHIQSLNVNNFTFPFNQGFVANNIHPIGSDTDLTTIGSHSRNENQSQRKTSSSSSSHSHYHRNSWQHYSSIDSRHKRKSSRQASNDWLNHGTNVEQKHLPSKFNWFEYQSDSIPFTPPSESSIRTGFHVSPTEIPPLQILPMGNVTASVGRNAVLECVINRPGQFKVAWLRMDDNSEPTLLTLGLHSLVTEDEGKYKVTHNERQWLLHVNRVQVHDRGRYMCQINAKTMTSQTGYLDVYEPPVINEELTSSDSTVDELQKVSLRCATSGYPDPSVSWRRENGKSLNLGLYGGKKFAANKWDGEYLNISQVTRDDMGAYLCIASNGVQPSVSKRIVLQVNFRPKIRVHNQLVSAYLGSDVELECRVEASPKPEVIWLTGTGQILDELLEQHNLTPEEQENNKNVDGHVQYNRELLNNHFIRTNINGQPHLMANHHAHSKRKKYQFEEESDGYKTVMRLTIRRLESADFGSYKCVAKNTLGEKEGLVRLYGM